DELIVILDKLLQIAEAEAATRRQCFQQVTLKDIIKDVVELYDATAEASGVTLTVDVIGEPTAFGDKDLLASATANLVDNALKYGGRAETTVRGGAREEPGSVSVLGRDAGPGIPGEARAEGGAGVSPLAL